ncbi:uncharacterized protein EV420DRAFT_1638675 [Desarmillaria tabescens]|uniref:EH domain-containing protein n=1 Tax=Armillaria tabescens TaxID=1929756 RepID=A0AA39TZC7_ARMTA|nr:uncharacterized protein EV420DRAFT_1638675 [Desarmillaria tabescens]KAK0463755.1 hypothetical protein EV420DRAFT_1638675 [Desarmillaria tabescens]
MTSVQSRIHAFESLSNNASSSTSPSSASLIDLKDWVVDVTPIVDVAPPLPPRTLKPPVTHTYPPKHTSASSISSFHSVSLDGQTSTDGDSIDDSSYENVSPIQPTPPKLPKRPPSASSTLTSTTSTTRRPPPPPPPASSSRSSITSTRPSSRASSTSFAPSLTRPTPIPPAARARYTSVFDRNISQRNLARQQRKAKPPPTLPFLSPRKSRQAAGWRGLSVDLITGSDDLPAAESDSEDDSPLTLPPHIVKLIWRKSRLEDTKLAQIWTECTQGHLRSQPGLTKDEFVSGMWKIDEELRRRGNPPKGRMARTRYG